MTSTLTRASLIEHLAFTLLFALICTNGNAARADSLPDLPSAPHLDVTRYPTCQTQWSQATSKAAKLQSIRSCANDVENFNTYYLIPFAKEAKKHSGKLTALDAQVRGSSISQADKDHFKTIIQDALDQIKPMDSSGDFGSAYTDYYVYFSKYQVDISNLQSAWRDVMNGGGA